MPTYYKRKSVEVQPLEITMSSSFVYELLCGREKLGNGEHPSLEAYKYEENDIHVLTIMRHKVEVKVLPRNTNLSIRLQ